MKKVKIWIYWTIFNQPLIVLLKVLTFLNFASAFISSKENIQVLLKMGSRGSLTAGLPIHTHPGWKNNQVLVHIRAWSWVHIKNWNSAEFVWRGSPPCRHPPFLLCLPRRQSSSKELIEGRGTPRGAGAEGATFLTHEPKSQLLAINAQVSFQWYSA